MTIYLRIGAPARGSRTDGRRGRARGGYDPAAIPHHHPHRVPGRERRTPPPTTGLSINSIYRRSAPGRGGGDGHLDDQVGKPARPLRATPDPTDAVARLRLRDRQERPHPHQRPRGGGRQQGGYRLLQRFQLPGHRGRLRPQHRRRRAEGGRAAGRPAAAAARRLVQGAGRRTGCRDRQSAGRGPHGHRRHRLRRPARHQLARSRASRSRAPSRPTPPSTTATRAVR